jgi:hypothetical protein
MIKWTSLQQGDIQIRLKECDTESKIGDDEDHIVLMHGISRDERVEMNKVVTIPMWAIKEIHDWYERWVRT